MTTVTFCGWRCDLSVSRYAFTPDRVPILSMRLTDADDHQPIAVATMNIPDVTPIPGCVIIKDYSENAGMTAALIKANVIHPEIIRSHSIGFVTVHEYRLTEHALMLWDFPTLASLVHHAAKIITQET